MGTLSVRVYCTSENRRGHHCWFPRVIKCAQIKFLLQTDQQKGFLEGSDALLISPSELYRPVGGSDIGAGEAESAAVVCQQALHLGPQTGRC